MYVANDRCLKSVSCGLGGKIIHDRRNMDLAAVFATEVLRDDDTLTSIAVKNDVSVGQLKFMNRMLLSGDKFVVPGTVLRLPTVRKSTIDQTASKNASDNTVGSTTQFSKERTISNGNTDATDHQGLLMVDPLVQTITSSSPSLCKDQSLSSAGAV
ncbi:hypothetical protein TSMEX_010834 [Taenia solium]|eukprot:TsM_000573500 transcript=TsM_000573500 gene=TsM_000573500